MRSRSWMAGLTLSAGVSTMLGLGTSAILGQSTEKTVTAPSLPTQPAAEARKGFENEEAKTLQSVMLLIGIAGLGADGCDVEIKAANPACRFRPVKKHIDPTGYSVAVVIKDLEVRRADRNCTFAITVNERDQQPRTILRGFRLAARPAGNASSQPPDELVCNLSSPSKMARVEEKTTRK